MLVVICMKWGNEFSSDYVNVLHSAVSRNISEPFRFVCLTDDPTGLRAGIEVQEIPEIRSPTWCDLRGGWRKLVLCKPDLVKGATLLFYLDLDVVILSSLDPFIDRARTMKGFHILREWNPGLWRLLPSRLRPSRGAQSSIMLWAPREQDHIYVDLMADRKPTHQNSVPDRKREFNHQEYITMTAHDLHYLPSDWTVSFKVDCVWYYPFNLVFKKISKPDQAKIVVFHGRPRPLDVVVEGRARWGTASKFGFGPVDWVRSYWLEALLG